MKELQKLPVSFSKEYEYKCSCGSNRIGTVNYNLKVDILQHNDINEKMYRAYRIYYQPVNCYDFTAPFIGENCGLGKENVKDLVDN